MLFEVIYHGIVKMYTKDENCIPPKEVLLDMQKAGYEFNLNGKPYKPQNKRQEKIINEA